MKAFHLSDVLSITTGLLVSNRHMAGIYDILGYMCGDDGITTIGLLAVEGPAKEAILKQYPQLTDVDTSQLSEMLEGITNKDTLQSLCNNWVNMQTKAFGEFLEISPMVNR